MKKDYIDILLEHLDDQRLSYAGKEYFLRQERERLAAEALTVSLSAEQKKLFLAYEAEKNAAASVAEEVLARQAFLLGREIFR